MHTYLTGFEFYIPMPAAGRMYAGCAILVSPFKKKRATGFVTPYDTLYNHLDNRPASKAA